MLILSMLSCLPVFAQKVAVAFYNCENFFDTQDDPAKEDEEFTPAGKYHYTDNIYRKKLHNIASVIQLMGDGQEPAIVGLVEIENNTVLNDLVRQPELSSVGYRYEWFEGPDPRSIDVAMLYDPKRFKVIKSEPLSVDITSTGGKSITRDVLHVHGILLGDTIHVFVNHWPSQRGGEEASEPKRTIAAQVNRKAINAIIARSPNAKVIVMGDLNDNPPAPSIVNALGAKGERTAVSGNALYNPWAALYAAGQGTEVYRKKWNLFDQVIISNGLLVNRNNKLHYDRVEIFKPGFIVDTYKGHEGEPHRSFAGTRWINGYSDHFPVILYLAK
jgi:hypothetical protein